MNFSNRTILLFILLTILSLGFASCEQEIVTEKPPQENNEGNENEGDGNEGDENQGGNENQGGDENGGTIDLAGVEYVWDWSVIPEITIEVPLDQWNQFLANYDSNNRTKEYVHCNVTYKKGNDVFKINDAAMRMRGNTSRRRPENGGSTHVAGNTDWSHFHIGLNLRKYQKDADHEIHGIRKMNLKWFKDDPVYAREVFCLDLFKREGIWTAANEIYCRLWIHVKGDPKPAYYGVYGLIEPYDNKFIERREGLFGSATGNLWKCTYVNQPADLRSTSASFGEDNNVNEYTYELKETTTTFAEAEDQLKDFILKLNGKSDDSFKKWIQEVCDVELLMKTYAINVAVGMWDDMWCNGNNYYLYFNSTDRFNYKVFLLPYDYDNTLGTGLNDFGNPATKNPLHWGDKGILMERMMKFDEFKQIYVDELKRLVNPSNALMDQSSASERIRQWQDKIREYVANDTGEDMSIEDRCAGWGNFQFSVTGSSNNYFAIKSQTINNLP